MNHSHVLYDSDPHFKIDPISRKITNESSTKTTIIQHDHNSERFTFEVPRYVEGHDLSLCNIVEVHYLNIEGNSKTVRNGVYSVDDLHVKEDDENTVACSWLISDNATQFVGQLQFLLRFACAQEDTGTIDYVWNTGIYNSISISLGIYNNDTPSDNRQPAFNFVTTIDGQTLKFFVGKQAKYDTLSHEDKQGLFAIITDDKTKAKIEKALADITDQLELKVVSSLDELTELIHNNVNKMLSISINKDITIYDKGTLPKYARGTVLINVDGDATINLVDWVCDTYVAFYNMGIVEESERWTVRDEVIAKKLSSEWNYEGEWNPSNPLILSSVWGYTGLYVIKLVETFYKTTFTFTIDIDFNSADYSYQSNAVVRNIPVDNSHFNELTVAWLEINHKNGTQLEFKRAYLGDTSSTMQANFKVYWKKIS